MNFNFGALGRTKTLKKRSLLDEILSQTQSSTSNTLMHPILVVPASATEGNISLGNVKQFLKDGQYTTATGTESGKVLVERRICDQTVTFEVYDSVTSFTEREWQRVVAVFLDGNSWQFKDWREFMESSSNSEYVKLFMRVRGYYLHFSDIAVPENVSKWNVKVLTLERNRRH